MMMLKLAALFEEKPYLAITALVGAYFLLKLMIFAAKLVFMPCGVNVRRI